MTLHPKYRARRTSRGFTLIELMITMTIIVVMVTLALPNIMGALKTKPIDRARNRVINLFQAAKNKAANDSNAYGVQVDPSNLNGMLTLHQGTSQACGSINWGKRRSTVLFGAPPGTGIDPDFEVDTTIPDRVEVKLVEVTPNSVQRVCFTPDGRFLNADTNQPIPSTDARYAAGEYIVTLSTYQSSTALGLPVHVIISYSGKGRFVFGLDPYSSAGEGGT